MLDRIIYDLILSSPGADSNLRDYSGKKAKQYLRNSASTRAQRKRSFTELALASEMTPRSSLGRQGSIVITHLTLQDAPCPDTDISIA